MSAAPVIKFRAGQRHLMRLIGTHRRCAIVARRQYGKTTIFSAIALKKMMKTAGHTVIFGSAKLNLSREIVRKEAEILQKAIASLRAGKSRLRLADGVTHKAIRAELHQDDFAELFEAQRLEMRYYHSDSVYSRTKVVALRDDTVGETGDLMADEIGRIGNWRAVMEAITPIIASNPDFRILFSTTPPPDDSHYSYEMLTPPVGTTFPVNPEGNLYKSEMGLTVLRVDAWDAFADGCPVYDEDTCEPLAPEEHRRRAHDKDAWDRNFGCKFIAGGSAACSLLALDSAQQRGMGRCRFIQVQEDSDIDAAIAHLVKTLGSGPVGIGLDLATTEKGISNPTALAVMEQAGAELIVPLVLTWKTKDEALAEERITRVVDAIARRQEGGRARALAVDATNERYWASSLRKKLASRLPVHLVVGSESAEVQGQQPQNWKQYLGAALVGELDDNHLTLPPERYLREDFRLVRKERGLFVCDPQDDGKHGDTFDSCKLARHSLMTAGRGLFVPKPFKRSRRLFESRADRSVAA